MRKLLELQANQIELDTGYWILDTGYRRIEDGERVVTERSVVGDRVSEGVILIPNTQYLITNT